ncbi:MAG: restriction endonuclease subunit S [Lachnospiraceae bacterium]|nr:restriction endonuclease subunit S [Lachnospiraceae bacterium]
MGPFGSNIKKECFTDSGVAVLNGSNLVGFSLNEDTFGYVTEEKADSLGKANASRGDVVITHRGTLGQAVFIPQNSTRDRYVISQSQFRVKCNERILPEYMVYYLHTPQGRHKLLANASQVGVPALARATSTFKKIVFEVPDIKYQEKVVSFLELIREKIEKNSVINNNLLEQVLAIYRNSFVNTINAERKTCRADEYFDISIGKTPPRKETQWFSTNPEDVNWVSISDMGTCGLYISSTSEQLTKEAVERHNVKVVPDNTVLLSFKLTVGRIAITNGEMTTNEAIAHFKTEKKVINEYLYCYLKCFNYQSMGSTSSIATAVNSKIIKGMPFVVPTDDEVEEFHEIVAPMFAQIKANQIEIESLATLRDTLLPKLMSGEIDVSSIEV